LLPLTHIAGVNVLVRSLELGTAAIDLRHAVEYPKADFTAIVPTQLFRALNGDQLLLNHLRDCNAVLVGGAALTNDLHSRARDAGINIITTYGMTETCGGCVYNGKPLDGVDLEIRDGYIAIKGAVLATTYLNNEAEWLKTFQDDWFLTKDLGSLDSNILTVTGRSDEIFISGGEKISLSAVEAILGKEYPSESFAAFSMDDVEWGSALHIALVQNSNISQEEISDSLTRALGHVAKPKGFLRIVKIPFTEIGKVDRQALIELAAAEKGLK
jgi:O-succinylbenzoic acid--CoA ligase